MARAVELSARDVRRVGLTAPARRAGAVERRALPTAVVATLDNGVLRRVSRFPRKSLQHGGDPSPAAPNQGAYEAGPSLPQPEPATAARELPPEADRLAAPAAALEGDAADVWRDVIAGDAGDTLKQGKVRKQIGRALRGAGLYLFVASGMHAARAAKKAKGRAAARRKTVEEARRARRSVAVHYRLPAGVRRGVAPRAGQPRTVAREGRKGGGVTPRIELGTFRRAQRRAMARIAALVAGAFWGMLAVDAGAQDGTVSDRTALETLYDATGGEGWTDSTNWRTAAALDTWFGVTTDDAGRVTELDLGENGLTGSLPPALGSLANLERLSLWGNELTGPIPSELGNLANLERVILSRNGLTGPIPGELRNLVRLEWLSLSRNGLTGPVPTWLGNLPRLQWLYLCCNALAGRVPGSLGSLPELDRVDVSYNWGLSGSLPPELRRTSLDLLDIFATPVCAPRRLG